MKRFGTPENTKNRNTHSCRRNARKTRKLAQPEQLEQKMMFNGGPLGVTLEDLCSRPAVISNRVDPGYDVPIGLLGETSNALSESDNCLQHQGWIQLGDQETAPATITNRRDDRYEQNDRRRQAFNLGRFRDRRIDDLAMHDRNDWFRFTVRQPLGPGAKISIDSPTSEGELNLFLYRNRGRHIARSAHRGNSETISLSGLAPGRYYVRVQSPRGAHTPQYTMTMTTGSEVTRNDDRYEQNDRRAHAHNLGRVDNEITINNLAMLDRNDWFRFTIDREFGPESSVRTTASQGQGDLDLFLYNSRGRRIRVSDSATNNEEIRLEDLGRGTYFVRVHGYGGARTPSYSLTIDPGHQSDDTYEDNDRMSRAANLGTLHESLQIRDLQMRDGQDWYQFRIRNGSTSGTVTIESTVDEGDLDLFLFDSEGRHIDHSDSRTNTEEVRFSNLDEGTYYVKVVGYEGAETSDYTLSVSIDSEDDRFEDNDRHQDAANLGILNSPIVLSDLQMRDGQDWFQFMVPNGISSGTITVGSRVNEGDLDLILFDSGGRQIMKSDSRSNNEEIQFTDLEPGAYYVFVGGFQGAETSNYTLTINPILAPPHPQPSSEFDIEISFDGGLSESQQRVFEEAARRWQEVIIGDLPDVRLTNGRVIDDLLIVASGVPIDGLGSGGRNTLGKAGPDAMRPGSNLPYYGSMEFDTVDLDEMERDGTLLSVILHEMGHVLGIGTLWQSHSLVTGIGSNNPCYVGLNALAAYNEITGEDSSCIPVENEGGDGSAGAHWRENVLDRELMTSLVEGPGRAMPLSRITIGSLVDMGYEVNVNAADSFAGRLIAEAGHPHMELVSGDQRSWQIDDSEESTSFMAGRVSHDDDETSPRSEHVDAVLTDPEHIIRGRKGKSLLELPSSQRSEDITELLLQDGRHDRLALALMR